MTLQAFVQPSTQKKNEQKRYAENDQGREKQYQQVQRTKESFKHFPS
jgi:hypothetical protein